VVPAVCLIPEVGLLSAAYHRRVVAVLTFLRSN
jgi:hypothetical protein